MGGRTARGLHTVSGASVAGLLNYARARGANLSPTLAQLGLDEATLGEPDVRVDVAANDLLWLRAAEQCGDSDFGLHAAQQMDLDAFHMVGHLALNSRTLGHALERIVAFSRLLHDAGRTEMESTPEGLRFYPGCRGLPVQPPRHVAEFVVLSAVLLGRLVTGRNWTPLRVCFEHAAPTQVTLHRRLFGVLPEFGAPQTYLLLSEELLALPVVTQSPSTLGRYLETYAHKLMEELAPATHEDVSARVVRTLLGGQQDGWLGVADVARRLGTTPRTLQRQLAADGVKFSELVERARRSCAERYLQGGHLPLAEISYLLGFADPSNFHRAFRRWTGMTPAAFRARALQDGAR